MSPRIAAPLALLVACLIVPGPVAACTGDCDGGGTVTIDELVRGVTIALGNAAVSLCRPADGNGNGAVSIDELVTAVRGALDGCPTPPTATAAAPSETPLATVTPPPNATPTAADTPTAAPRGPFCDLPGSVRFTAAGQVVVPGGPSTAPDLSFLQLPDGFCAHYYGTVGNARQLRFAPGGELFVASPSTLTTGGGMGGLDAIVILPDDDGNGLADVTITFIDDLPSTQGMLFANGSFYYQDRTRILRRPYHAGDRAPAEPSEEVLDVDVYSSRLHWPKTLDSADDGTIYVANGGDQNERCDPARPFRGGILKIDGSPSGAPVAKGMRSAISIRCLRGYNKCYAIELARDYTNDVGGREKLVPVREGDDWGHPCCATQDKPYPDLTPVPDCAGVAKESVGFSIGLTPFDLDFETGKWPEPWRHRVYVPMHGVFGSWVGACLVSFGIDPQTGDLIPGAELPGTDPGSFAEFARGWDDGTRTHGRPANIAFAPDGRLFLGNDNSGEIIWIAPLDL